MVLVSLCLMKHVYKQKTPNKTDVFPREVKTDNGLHASHFNCSFSSLYIQIYIFQEAPQTKTIWIQEAPTQIISQLHKYADLFRCPSVCETKALQLLHICM